MVDSSDDSTSDCFEIRRNSNVNKPFPWSPLTRKHEDDEVISGTEAMLRRRKQPKTTMAFVSSSSTRKIIWAKNATESASNENMQDQAKKNVPCVEQEQDALEAAASFRSLEKNQQKMKLENLENLGAQRIYELLDEWNALINEEKQLIFKKLIFSAKLANA
ncbi:GLABROUS1 enhancer-binding protein-like 3 [Eutrema salsugineum]|uniref:GLABROUS1 enhancer-binding protein-like 3 n=1 Tax=Eutrema salsugineum TaxID=72664 RepID=UPI000CED3068|nr:GLABROUS1 enhancer-binding protein-like 3 [Eutrema salsugineum]